MNTVTAAEHVLDGTLAVDLTSTGTSATAGFPEWPLGYQATTKDGAVYRYIHAAGAITQYYAVYIDESFEAAPITTTLSGSEPQAVGIADQVAIADNAYGFVLVKGPGSVQVAVGCSINTKLYTHTTAGYVIGTSTGDLISGLQITTAPAGVSTNTACYAAVEMSVNTTDKG